jgi:thioredoxin-like negative regulator of GroEL
VSVILDALRRSRKGASTESAASGAVPPPASAPRQVPAGLGLGGSSPAGSSGLRPARTRLLGLGALLVVALGVWAAIRVSQLLISNAPPAQSAASFPSTRGTPTPQRAPSQASPSQAAAPAPIPPPAAVTSGAPMTAPSSPAASAPRAVLSSRPRTPQARTANAEPRTVAPGILKPEQAIPEPRIPESAPRNPDEDHFALAVRHHNLGNYEEALKHYLAVLASDEFNVEARNNLGLLYQQRGLTTEAIDQLRRAITINPQYVRARSNLAVVLMDDGRLAEARAELRAATTIEPRNADLIVNMALVEKADQHRDLAIELLVRAIGYQPTHGMAHYNLAVLYEEQSALALAYDHYTGFLKYAGPEYGALLSDVQRRLLTLKPELARTP